MVLRDGASPKMTFSNDAQLLKAPPLNEVTLSGMVISLSPEPSKVYPNIARMLSGSSMLSSDEQFWNALLSMVVRFAGSLTEVRLVHPVKIAGSRISFTPL